MERANGPASVLAIGTATPPNVFNQADFPDFYFNITNSNHMTDLKSTFQRMCEKSGISKRALYLNEEILKDNPSLCAYWEPSFDVRQEMLAAEIPRLSKEAALKAIKEWDQPRSKITHLVVSATSGVHLPGSDWGLMKSLGLRPSVKLIATFLQGCFAGATAMRIAKDLAENNEGARVLAVCAEVTAICFRGPSETNPETLLGHALFGDGAAAVIVGSDPIPEVERPWFQIHWTGSNILPDSAGAIRGHLREVGLHVQLRRDIPEIVSKNLVPILKDVFAKALPHEGALSFNDVFWIAHPGGRAVLDQIDQKLELKAEKQAANRKVLSDYGNMWGPTVMFIMDYMRKKSVEQKLATSGEGCEWGVLLGFGPGVTCETVILKSMPLSI